MTPEQAASLGHRFASKIQVASNGCWEWTAAKRRDGYGVYKLASGTTVIAHRHSYQTLIGPIPDGLQLDHLCRNRPCCNPEHLEPVTNRENSLRSPLLGDGVAVAQQSVRDRTHCPHGHAYDGVNTGWTRAGHRYCKTCNRERARRNYATKRSS